MMNGLDKLLEEEDAVTLIRCEDRVIAEMPDRCLVASGNDAPEALAALAEEVRRQQERFASTGTMLPTKRVDAPTSTGSIGREIAVRAASGTLIAASALIILTFLILVAGPPLAARAKQSAYQIIDAGGVRLQSMSPEQQSKARQAVANIVVAVKPLAEELQPLIQALGLAPASSSK